MKPTLILFIVLKCALLCAQSDSTLFDKDFVFRNGIYSSFNELLNNSPKYPDIKLETRSDLIIKEKTLYINDGTSIKYVDKDSVFAIVQKGKMAINYKDDFHKLILLGSISTFVIEYRPFFEPSPFLPPQNTMIYETEKGTQKSKVYYLDLKTGYIDRLDHRNMDEVLKRDNSLYADYSLATKREKKKTLYSYVVKYNSRNPTYIKK